MNKNKMLWSVLIILFASMFSVSLVSCGDDDDDNPDESTITTNDPEGTILVNMSNTFYFDGKYYNYGVALPGLEEIDFGMTKDNNFEVGHSPWIYWYPNIVNVGKVNGLSSIKRIPDSGWDEKFAVIPGNGYICRARYEYSPTIGEYVYARIYVVSYITNTANEIIGATIKYQSPWKP